MNYNTTLLQKKKEEILNIFIISNWVTQKVKNFLLVMKANKIYSHARYFMAYNFYEVKIFQKNKI